MPKVKTVSVAYERKFNLGNYESATIGFTAWADIDVEGGEDLNEAMEGLWKMAKTNVRAQSANDRKNRPGGQAVDENDVNLPLGLPESK